MCLLYIEAKYAYMSSLSSVNVLCVCICHDSSNTQLLADTICYSKKKMGERDTVRVFSTELNQVGGCNKRWRQFVAFPHILLKLYVCMVLLDFTLDSLGLNLDRQSALCQNRNEIWSRNTMIHNL